MQLFVQPGSMSVRYLGFQDRHWDVHVKVLFHNYFSLAMSTLTTYLGCQLYRNISQILLLYKVLGYRNKFDCMKSLGVCYWYFKRPQYGYVEHGLGYFSCHVQKHMSHLAACSGPPVDSRRAARGAHISGTHLLSQIHWRMTIYDFWKWVKCARIICHWLFNKSINRRWQSIIQVGALSLNLL